MKKVILLVIISYIFIGNAFASVTAVAKSHNGTNKVTVNVNEPCFFYAKDSYGGSGNDYLSLRNFEWDFDASDGINFGDSISSFTYYKYSTAGTRTVTLRVTDDKNNTSTASITVTVQNAPTGSTFYVNKNGDDSNGCTNNSSDACLTINGALGKAAVGAGDKIIVGSGSYHEVITFKKGGIENKPITIKAASETIPIIYYTSNAFMINFNGYDYITIDGFEIDGRSIADAIFIPSNSTHISIKNCEIHHIDSNNLGAPKKYNGLTLNPVRSNNHLDAPALWTYVFNTYIHNNAPCNVNISSWGNVFENVVVIDPGLTGNGEDNYVLSSAGHGNYFKGGENGRSKSEQDAHQDAWELYGASNVTLDGMEIYNSEAELIMCDAAVRPSTDMCDNLVFVNNIIYRNYPVDQQQLKLRCGFNFKVFNNVFYGRVAPIVLDSCQNNNGNSFGFSMNNVFMGTGGNCSNNFGTYSVYKSNNSYYNCKVSSGEINVITANPIFVDPRTDKNGNFELMLNSPLINSGINTGYLFDKHGNIRTKDSFDIGAYEYIGGSTGGTTINTPKDFSVDK